MSDRPDDQDDAGEAPEETPEETPTTGGPETGESGGFGLTAEFDRIEAEIQEEIDRAASRAADEPAAEEPATPEEPAADEPAESEEPAEPAETEEPATPEEPEPDQAETVKSEQPPADQAEKVEQATEVSTPVSEPAATEHPLITPMPRPTPIAVAASIPDEELEEKTPRLWLPFLVGSLLIILSMATATTALGLIFFTDLAEQLSDNQIKGVNRILAFSEGGEPQTILLIGSDKRSSDPAAGARSDTTMLLRVDPDKKALALFSLPRDLVVDIPGYGTDRLNAAFSIGNAKLTLKTVQQLTGLEINHLVRIDFEGFGAAVNAIDCVYIDIDRDYFNVNDGSIATDFANIDINPGYQRLCGQDALDYVRYRHTDTDIVRAARQQDFLREARQKVPTRELLPSLGGDNELIDIFTEYTESDIDSAQEIIGILKSFLGVVDAPVTEVHFEGDIGDATNTEVTATKEEIQTSVDQFLGVEGTSGPRGGENALNEPKPADTGKAGNGKGQSEDKPEEPVTEATVIAADPGFERFALTVERRRDNLAAFYPSVMETGSLYDPTSREYDICVEGPVEGDCKETEAAYKLVIRLIPSSTLPEYYGVMGTTWDDPPILRSPSETREIDGREYLLFYDGERLRMVGFMFEGSSYWVNNTLTQAIDEPDMLEIATTMSQAHLKEK